MRGKATYLASLLLFMLPSGLLLVQACGSENAFAPLQKRNDKDKGKAALANGDYDTAIRELEKYCGQHPDDSQCKSMLANAYMKKSGIDELQIAAKITEAQKTKGGGDLDAMLGAMPAGTPENVAALEKAVSNLSAIPAENRTPDQNYQLAVASASLAVTIAKKSATDENGKISAAKVDQLSDAEAITMVESLNTTKSALSASGQDSSGGGAGKLGGLADKIAAQEGASDSDKLRAYLKSSGAK